MTTSESKGRFFLQNESIRTTNRIDSNRELECSTLRSAYGNDVKTAPATLSLHQSRRTITVRTFDEKSILAVNWASCQLVPYIPEQTR